MKKTSSSPRQTKIVWTGFFIRLAVLFLIAILFYLGNLVFNLNKNIARITTNQQESSTKDRALTELKTFREIIQSSSNETKLKQQNNRINILLLGIGGKEHKGAYLTDTITLLSINTQTYQTAMLSIPRDLYVQIPGTNYHTKINALYTYGLKNQNKSPGEAISLIKKSVEKITGQKINYYIVLDFEGFKEIIKTLDGIDLEVPADIVDNRYPGPNYSYETFKISKGFHHLDAETALKYARVRHVSGGDFGRARRQQQIIASVKKKATSLKILFNPLKINSLLNSLGEHLRTNIKSSEIVSFIRLAKNINIYQTNTKILDAWSKDSLLKSDHIQLGGVWAYILLPKDKSYHSIQALAENIFNLKNLQEKKEKIRQEQAGIEILTPDYNSYIHFKKIFQNWGYRIQPYRPQKYTQICPLNQEILLAPRQTNKLFTIDDLVAKLDLKVIYYTEEERKEKNKNEASEKPSSTTGKTGEDNKTDITICLLKDSYRYFENQSRNKNSKVEENSILNTQGEVLINK